MGGQSQPVLRFSTGSLHGGIQWFESWLTKTPPAEGSYVGPAWRLNTEVRRPMDWGTLNTQQICLPGGKKSWLPLMKCAALSVRFFLQESGIRCPKGWHLFVGISDCSWHSGEGQHRSQGTGPVSSPPEQPPKIFSAKLSTGCRFQLQLAQGALHLALWKMMKAKSKRVMEFSQRGGYNHLPWTGYSGMLGECWNHDRFRRNIKISNLPGTERGFSRSWECSQAAQTMFSSLLSCRYIGKSI